jgi:3-oxoacyl-[acyl-carrier-protein] synthase II
MFADPSLPYVTPLCSPYITATKANLGHTLGAASILGMIATIRSMTSGLLPPMGGFRIDPKCRRPWLAAGITARKDNPLVIVTRKTRANIQVALCNAFGFGGHNAVTVVARPDFQQ